MTRDEKLQEAKLMAVENILIKLLEDDSLQSLYEYSKEILSAIRNEEIKAELADHEANPLIASENKPS